MAGIFLTPERLRNAPAEVRDWLEREFAQSIEALPQHSALSPHVVPIELATAQKLLMRVAAVLPLANLLFELARGGNPTASGRNDIASLAELILHARFDSPARISRAIGILNEITQDVLDDPSALICEIDLRGSYYIAVETRKSLALLWQALVADLDGLLASPGSLSHKAPERLSEHGAISAAVRPDSFAWSIPSQREAADRSASTSSAY
jgi:hypothetical protein